MDTYKPDYLNTDLTIVDGVLRPVDPVTKGALLFKGLFDMHGTMKHGEFFRQHGVVIEKGTSDG